MHDLALDSVLDTVGRTPVVRLRRLESCDVELYAKLESRNPTSSTKDRIALAMIRAARADGRLRPGQTVVEATSGNTGIGLAMVCASLGHPLVVVMAENFSIERRRLMRFMGARVVLTPAHLRGSGMREKARELAQAHGWYFPDQFRDPANAQAHAEATAAEIMDAFQDRPLTHWFTGWGSGGTLLGAGGELKWQWPRLQIVACEPDAAPVIATERLRRGSREQPAMIDHPHPAVKPHLMQGWAPDFWPGPAAEAVAAGLIDHCVAVAGEDAITAARLLARREGILAGLSGGATLAAALAMVPDLPANSRALVMLPDTGERYLSTPLFADIGAEMNDEEWALSESTPGARFVPPTASPPPATVNELAARQLRTDEAGGAPVVLFTLRWCEFGWAVRRLFDIIGVALRVVEVDAPDLVATGRGQQIRARVVALTQAQTLPQLFVADRLVGGCTDSLTAWDQGQLARWLRAEGLSPKSVPAGWQAQSLLPNWLHPRSREAA